MKFDVVIGNPPYQETPIGDNDNYTPPIYHYFLDSAYSIADVVEMIHPARFLFNGGSTPKEWNNKMLNDEHLKVLKYEPNSKKIFHKDIKGGIAITFRNNKRIYGKIGLFTSFYQLNSIYTKVVEKNKNFYSLSEIIYAAESYHFTEIMHKENPHVENMLSKGHKYDLKSNVLEKLANIVFFEHGQNGYVGIIGRKNNERITMYIDSRYISSPDNFSKYKVLLPNANGSGALGEVLTTPLIGTPLIGHTQTFLSIGKYDTREEAECCLKYLKSKFARTLLGILKVTQSNSKPAWKFVPLQDFTNKSDIDWSKSIHEIDLQLYKKYGLDDNEINFIETRVKEMA